jgi:hypothetical protein
MRLNSNQNFKKVLTTMDTSKEMNFYAYSKCIIFIKFCVIHQICPEKICPIFEKEGNTTKILGDLNANHTIIFSILE